MSKLYTVILSRLKYLVIAASMTLPTVSNAFYAMSASPTLQPEQAEALYQPVAKLLSEKLNIDIDFQYDGNWQEFTKHLFADEYHVIVTEPHVAAYLADVKSNLAMILPLRLEGDVFFHVVVNGDHKATSLKSLRSRRICMLPSPNFSGVMIKKEYSNPVVQPVVVEVKGDFNNIYQRFQEGLCEAAVIDDETYQNALAQGDFIRSVHTTVKAPNVGLVLSERVSVPDRAVIVKALTNVENSSVLQPLAAAYGSDQETFTITDGEIFRPFNILPGVVWGW